jgi:hypothetical protein
VSDAKASNSLQEETARYVGGMAAELATMARDNGLAMVSYFLELARLEALACAEKRQKERDDDSQRAA